ncbi:MAG: hypothetical protein OXF54_08260 [Caldilineaceae bacterium]|nr:hypothetical protein [Caldilineaceae bacterium]
MLRGAIPLSVGNLKILRALDFEDETPDDAIPSQLSGRAGGCQALRQACYCGLSLGRLR